MKKLLDVLLFIRQGIWVIYLSVMVLIFGTLSTLLYFLKAPRFMRVGVVAVWSWCCRAGMLLILWQWIRIIGKENRPAEPCVYICKHQSFLETVFLPSMLPRSVFVLKKELMSIPVFGRGLRATEAIPIDRSKGVQALKDVVTLGKDRLAKGISIAIFPEGTRIPPRQHPEFHKSGLMLANSCGHQVVMVAHNAGRLCPVTGKLIRPGLITVVISKPIRADDYSLQELTESTHQWIRKQMLEIEGRAE